MRRASLLCIAAVTAIVAVACGEGEAIPASPTGPSNQPVASTPSPSPAPQPVSAPNPPANLTVTSVVGTTVTLSWTPSAGATQYIVIVGTQPSSSNTLLTNTTQPTYQWGGVAQGKHYARVQATNSFGTSTSSNEVEFTVN